MLRNKILKNWANLYQKYSMVADSITKEEEFHPSNDMRKMQAMGVKVAIFPSRICQVLTKRGIWVYCRQTRGP